MIHLRNLSLRRKILWHAAFLRMLPAIQQYALICFRSLNSDAREEALQEVTANALTAFVRGKG